MAAAAEGRGCTPQAAVPNLPITTIAQSPPQELAEAKQAEEKAAKAAPLPLGARLMLLLLASLYALYAWHIEAVRFLGGGLSVGRASAVRSACLADRSDASVGYFLSVGVFGGRPLSPLYVQQIEALLWGGSMSVGTC